MRTNLLKLLLVFAVASLFVGCCGKSRINSILQQIHDPESKQVLVISHRGDWRNYPENSLLAIESVINMGADMVEIDVQLTKDSVLVLMHDGTIDRCTTGKGWVRDMTYDEIQQYALRTEDASLEPEDLKIPTLREALEVCRDRITVNIDKGYDYYDLVLALTEELGVTEQVLMKGSHSYEQVKAKFSKYQNNMLYMPIISPLNAGSAKIFDGYMAAPDKQLAYEICFNKLTPEVEQTMRRILEGGSKLWVNTLWNSLCGGLTDDLAYKSSPDDSYGKLIDMGVTMIQTDRPEFLLDYLRERGLHD